MPNKILYNEEARQKILDGIQKIASAVKLTLGPRGQCVIIEKQYTSPLITKDGVTVAREIELEDRYENVGAELVKEVAAKTNDITGDGTTTAIILMEAIYKEGLKNIIAGANPLLIQCGIEQSVKDVIIELKIKAKPQKNKQEIIQIATIASNYDTEIGNIISLAVEKVGKNGIITVEESKSTNTYLDVVDGFQIDQGYISPYFQTDIPRATAVLINPFIFVYEGKLTGIKELVPLLEMAIKNKRQLLIVADDVTGEALAALVLNKIKGVIPLCAVRAPAYGEKRKILMNDLAIATGGQYITKALNIELNKISIEHLGQAKQVTINKDSTIIIGGNSDKKTVQERVIQIKNIINNAKTNWDKEEAEKRLAKLTSGIAVINIGAVTESEMKEKRSRAEDAIHATRAAIDEGIIPGGGVALFRASYKILKLIDRKSNSLREANEINSDEITGMRIIFNALQSPLRQIVANAGKSADVVCQDILNNENENYGYDVEKEKYCDMITYGIIDPVKVTRVALENAASVASLLLTANAVIVEKIKEEKESNA